MAIDVLRRILLCFTPTTTVSSAATTPKKRLSTSLRDDIKDSQEDYQDFSSSSSSFASTTTVASAVSRRQSKSMVIGTIFGNRRGHVWFCVQHNRLSSKPIILLELSILTSQLVQEMRFGLVRIALECDGSGSGSGSGIGSCPLRAVPVWTMFCNGRRIGSAVRRKSSSERVRMILKTMECVSVGAGVIPAGLCSGLGSGLDELLYMRAHYEHVVGSADSESFHLINPDESPGQELSVFLLRS